MPCKKIAITGNIGAGKSLASYILRQKGYFVADADEISKEVLSANSPLLKAILKLLGKEIIQEDGSLNRKKVAQLIFSDEKKYEIYTKMVQDAILKEMQKQLENIKDIAFAEVPLLFEAKWNIYFDEIWLICAEKELRIKRVMQRSSMTREEVEDRIKKQIPQEEKEKLATYCLKNNTNIEDLKKQIEACFKNTTF